MAAPTGYTGEQLTTLRLIQQRAVATGRPSTITALAYSSGQLSTLAIVSDGFAFGELESDGRRLQPEVQFELWITNDQIALFNGQDVAAWLYDGITYQIVRPSPFKPSGADIFWRFWLSPQEDAS